MVNVESDILHSLVHQHAEKLSLEGMVQPVAEKRVKIMACGSKEKMDQFLDTLYAAQAQKQLYDIQIEPFYKDRDYRGIFRILE